MSNLKESGGYPLGTEFNPEAPWNEKNDVMVTKDIDVTITIKKKVKIKLPEYYVNSIKDTPYSVLQNAVREQTLLPQDAYLYVCGDIERRKKAFDSLLGWKEIDLQID